MKRKFALDRAERTDSLKSVEQKTLNSWLFCATHNNTQDRFVRERPQRKTLFFPQVHFDKVLSKSGSLLTVYLIQIYELPFYFVYII